MEQGLCILTSKQPWDWAKWLPIVQYTKNAWINSTMKKTPFELILGYCERGKVLGTYTMLGEFDGRMIRLDGCMDGLAISKDKRMH
jgi:hypothetical protein